MNMIRAASEKKVTWKKLLAYGERTQSIPDGL